jgi:hypothetical protein
MKNDKKTSFLHFNLPPSVLRLFYQPNFCCDCGERISLRKGLGAIFTSRQFCSKCIGRFSWLNRKRIPISFKLICAGFFLGIILARGQAFERTSSTIPPRPPAGLPEQINRSSSSSGGSVEKIRLCGARTRNGRACRRKVKTEGYCWQHRDPN